MGGGTSWGGWFEGAGARVEKVDGGVVAWEEVGDAVVGEDGGFVFETKTGTFEGRWGWRACLGGCWCVRWWWLLLWGGLWRRRGSLEGHVRRHAAVRREAAEGDVVSSGRRHGCKGGLMFALV